MRRMRVLYDISKLTEVLKTPAAKTGIARVVEEVGVRLCANSEVCVQLCAQREPIAAFGYVRSHQVFANQPFAISPVEYRRKAFRDRLVDAYAKNDSEGTLYSRLRVSLLHRIDSYLWSRPESYQDIARHCDIYHSPDAAIPSVLRSYKHLAFVQTIYDLSPLRFPEVTTDLQKEYVQSVIGAIRDDDWVIADSESAKDDLCEFRGFDPERVSVTYLAADDRLFYPCEDAERLTQVREKYGIPDGPYLLSVCTLEPRKNLTHVVGSFVELVRQEGMAGLNLVLVGGKGWMIDRLFEEIDALGDLRDRVILTGYVDDADLAPLYSGAEMFVYMSLYEGFGLPPLEAMQCGTPVICSNTSSLPEVVGNAGILLDPRDRDGLCQAIHSLHGDAARREALARRSRARAQHFSWEKCAREHVQVYARAVAAGK